MSKKSRREYTETMRMRYQQMRGKRAKSRLLDEYCEVTGYDRKYANKLLLGIRGAGAGRAKKAGRKRRYGPEVVEVLKRLWFWAEQACGKRLAPVLPLWLGSYEKRYGRLSKGLKEKLLKISPAQIDRVLGPTRVKAGKRPVGVPKSHAVLKELTPIRAEAWDVEEPGWIEADTVAHGGGSAAGSFIWTLSSTDLYSGWTEIRAAWNKGQHAICGAFEQIEGRLPFGIKGVDTDNGPEFLNWHFRAYFKERREEVELTRSRAYKKKDQAHIEQKNFTHVRQLLGYDRLGDEEMVGAIDELLERWSEWNNLYSATMKQEQKKREGGRLIRRHEKRPKTPGQRLIEYWKKEGEEEKARAMEREMQRRDPIEMKEEIEKRFKQVWEMKESLEAAEAEEEGAEAPPGQCPPPLRSGGHWPGEETETRTERTKSKTESLKQSQLTPV